MDAVQIRFKDGLLAGLADLVVHLALGLFDHLLNARGMDAAVGNQLFQRDARDFAAHRIKGGDDHSLRRIVDNQIHARSRLQRADIAALAADDAALHIVVGQRHYGNRSLGHMVCRALLNGGGNDVAGLFVGLLLGALLDLTHHDGGVVVGVLLHAINEDVLGLVRGHVGHALQLLLLAVVHALRFLLKAFGLLIFFVELLLARFQVVQLLVKLLLALVHATLHAGNLAAAIADFLVQLVLQADDLLLGFQYSFLFLVLGLARRLFKQISGVFFRLPDLLFHGVFAVEISGRKANRQRDNRDDDNYSNAHGAFLPLFPLYFSIFIRFNSVDMNRDALSCGK